MPKKCNMNRVQHEATRHERSATNKKVRHENSTNEKV